MSQIQEESRKYTKFGCFDSYVDTSKVGSMYHDNRTDVEVVLQEFDVTFRCIMKFKQKYCFISFHHFISF